MERYEVRFLKDALDDLEEIVLYIARDNKKAALEMHDTIVKTANDLAIFPKRGPLVPDKKIANTGFRMLLIGRYILFYKIDADIVHIHRVLHGARSYPTLLQKTENDTSQ